jgi:hypothetical protein
MCRVASGGSPTPLWLVLRHDLQGLAEQRHGLTLRPPLSSVLGGDLEKPKGLVNVSSLPPMMGQQAGGLSIRSPATDLINRATAACRSLRAARGSVA